MPTREHPEFAGMKSAQLDAATVSQFDAVVITTDHSNVDYASMVSWSKLVIDTRNATKNVQREGVRIISA